MHSVDEILRDAGARLRQSLTTEPSDRSIAAETEFRRRVRRRQVFQAGGAAVIIVALAVGAIVATGLGGRVPDQRDVPPARELRRDPELRQQRIVLARELVALDSRIARAAQLRHELSSSPASGRRAGRLSALAARIDELVAEREMVSERLSQLERELGIERTCPSLLVPGPHARREALRAAWVYVWSHTIDPHWRSFKTEVSAAEGAPQGGCGQQVWHRTFVATVTYRYPPGSAAAKSASLASSTLFAGRTDYGWTVWLQFH